MYFLNQAMYFLNQAMYFLDVQEWNLSEEKFSWICRNFLDMQAMYFLDMQEWGNFPGYAGMESFPVFLGYAGMGKFSWICRNGIFPKFGPRYAGLVYFPNLDPVQEFSRSAIFSRICCMLKSGRIQCFTYIFGRQGSFWDQNLGKIPLGPNSFPNLVPMESFPNFGPRMNLVFRICM